MTKVAVVGAGLIGRAWAISFARAGHEVAITDADAAAAEKALSFIDEALKDLQRFDLLNGACRRRCAAGSARPAAWRMRSKAPSMSRRMRPSGSR